jgi:hypothetical protein
MRGDIRSAHDRRAIVPDKETTMLRNRRQPSPTSSAAARDVLPGDPVQRSADEPRAGRASRISKAGAGLLAAGIVTAGVGASVGTAHAAVDPYYVLSGNFAGDGREEVFVYVPGGGQDFLLTNFVDTGSGFDFDAVPFNVNGFYDPVVGDFDGEGLAEILWYGIGSAPDFLWNFSSVSSVQSVPYTANGVYDPVAGDLTGDGIDDILWYAPGPAQDYLWDFNGAGAYRSHPRTINGRYTPVVGSFGTDATDDIFWYSPGSAADFLWDFAQGTTSFTSTPYAVSGSYRPFSGDFFGEGFGSGDIFWYAPGPGRESIWDFVGGERFTLPTDPVNGTYIAGTGDLFGSGADAILWVGSDATLIVWTFGDATATSATSDPVEPTIRESRLDG